MLWCRKCRRFSKTFFVEGEQGCSPESAKHRTSLGKSTDVLPQNYGCFHRKSPMFLFSGKRAEQACSKLCQASDRGRRSQGKQTEAAVWTISEHGIQPSFLLKKICRTATTRNVDRKRIHTQTAQEKTLRRGHRLRPDPPPSMPLSRQISAKS